MGGPAFLFYIRLCDYIAGPDSKGSKEGWLGGDERQSQTGVLQDVAILVLSLAHLL